MKIDITAWGDSKRRILDTETRDIEEHPITCKYGDPFCPCQDGHTCNHERKITK